MKRSMAKMNSFELHHQRFHWHASNHNDLPFPCSIGAEFVASREDAFDAVLYSTRGQDNRSLTFTSVPVC